jgi:hypothetical protein
LGRAIVAALIIGIALSVFAYQIHFTTDVLGLDMAAYYNAAVRLRDGADLYPMVANQESASVYRYAPWFAVLWIPFTLLPFHIVAAGWAAILLGAGGYLLWPLRRTGTGLLLALFAMPYLVEHAWVGNVDPLMYALLAATVSSRLGGLGVGVAASLKIAPIGFVVYFALQRRWCAVWVSLFVAAGLWAPAVLFNLSHYPMQSTTLSLWRISPLLWAAVSAIGIVGAIWLAHRQPRYRLLAGAVAALLAVPRIQVSFIGYLLIPAGSSGDPGTEGGRT